MRELSGVQSDVTWLAENDAFAPSRCRDLLPKRRTFHVRKFADMVHLAWHIGRTTMLAGSRV